MKAMLAITMMGLTRWSRGIKNCDATHDDYDDDDDDYNDDDTRYQNSQDETVFVDEVDNDENVDAEVQSGGGAVDDDDNVSGNKGNRCMFGVFLDKGVAVVVAVDFRCCVAIAV